MLFLDEVLENYSKENIVFVDGEDMHGICEKVVEYADKGFFFMREIPGTRASERGRSNTRRGALGTL